MRKHRLITTLAIAMAAVMFAAPQEPYEQVLEYLAKTSPQLYQNIKEYSHDEAR